MTARLLVGDVRVDGTVKSRFTTGMKTSTRQDWKTPKVLFTALDREFGFTLDAASSKANALTEEFHDTGADGLGQSWSDHVVWLNPPYRFVGPWMHKARREAADGAVVVCLVPARCDTEWWNVEVVPFATEIRFIRGRLRFHQPEGIVWKGHNAPFPSAVVVFYGANVGDGRPELSTIWPDGSPFQPPVRAEPLL